MHHDRGAVIAALRLNAAGSKGPAGARSGGPAGAPMPSALSWCSLFRAEIARLTPRIEFTKSLTPRKVTPFSMTLDCYAPQVTLD